MENKLKIIISGAQTGGHIYPAIAVAKKIYTLNKNSEILFIGTNKEIERKIFERENFKFVQINVDMIKGMNLKRIFKALTKMPFSLYQSIKIIRNFKPHVVVGFGSSSSGPVLFAAWLLGIPTAIAEQNSIPGLTNRILSRFVKKIFLSYENKNFPKNKVLLSGNPVREEILKVSKRSIEEKPFTLLVLGGSQGSRFLNKKIPSFMKKIAEKLNNEISVIHQTGESEYNEVLNLYKDSPFSVYVLPYIYDIWEIFSKTHFVIARAGAGTIAEINACGLPSLLIPFPHSADNHQLSNALVNQNANASIVVEEKNYDEKEVCKNLIEIFKDKNKILKMGENAFNLSKKFASEIIAKEVLKLALKGQN